jgi:rod shape-determining protein MreB and related proteins
MLSSFIFPVYVQISPDRLIVRNVKTGLTFSEVPELAIERKSKLKILDIGVQARSHSSKSGVEIINPFAHPRTLVSDFGMAEQLLKLAIRRILKASLFSVSPTMVLHPMGDPDGGFTQVESRAFREMALSTGASQVIVWQGRNLTDQEILSKQFPSDGKILA